MEKQIDLVRFEIAKLELKENDVLVFKFVGEKPELDELECLVDSLNFVLPKDVKALILFRNDLELAVIHKEMNS